MAVKRVLLTGAAGFVGHHTLDHILTTTNWDVVCIDSFNHRGVSERITDVMYSDPSFVDRMAVFTHDLRAPISPTLMNRIGKIDYIINMASESHVDRSIDDPRPFVENNVALILTMLDYARIAKPAKFLQISTDEVFGPAPEGYDHKEWDPTIPSNPYSASKAAQESIAISYWRTYDVPVIISNTMNIIGERQDVEKFVPMVIQKVINGDTVEIHADKNGVPGSRYYLHARNQADAIVYLLKRVEPNMYPESDRPSKYNIVGEREVDNLEMALLIANAAGKKLDYKMVDFHSKRPGHDLRYSLDGTALHELGWKSPVPLESSLEKTVKWTLENEEWVL